ncbi:MAG TPA: hypothetical protein VGG45_04625 [Terracidiphilus sp.]|jgi:hypothetical protein
MKDDEIVKAVLGNYKIESIARYLSLGRPLQSLDEATLKQRWIDELRRALREKDGNSALSEKVCAEASLRGGTLELPPDLQATLEQTMGSSKFLEGLADEIIEAFEHILAKPKN